MIGVPVATPLFQSRSMPSKPYLRMMAARLLAKLSTSAWVFTVTEPF